MTETRDEERLVVEMETDLPQDTDCDIRAPERLMLGFERNDRDYPTVHALRADFPAVPHLFWTPFGEPRSLCLYEAPWAEVRLRWTGARFLGDIARWLARTAIGELHDADQPLEPFFFGSRHIVVIPDGLFEGGAKWKTSVAVAVDERKGKPALLKLLSIGENELQEKACLHVITAVGELAVQDAMHDCPRNMMELIELLRFGGIDLVRILGDRLGVLFECERKPLEEDQILLLVMLSRRRRPAGAAEALETWAFAIGPIHDVAVATGYYASSGRGVPLGRLLKPQFDDAKACDVEVRALRTVRAIDRAAAKYQSGLDPGSADPAVVLVGTGALGSQLHNHLSRMGWGRWTLIDEDTVLPHNVVRHRLGEPAVGFPKAIALQVTSAVDTPHNPVDRVFAEDFLSIGENKEMLGACSEADLILDVSTSIAVARRLAVDLEGPARRASLFLNPGGCDAVMLMEDSGRSLRLDALEAQYYRAIVRDCRLDQHIKQEKTFRYSAGCRDVATRIGQDGVALASALLARQVRSADADATAAVWQQEADGGVRRVDIPLSDETRVKRDGWCFVLDSALVEHVSSLRRARLPVETGGVLIGYFDVSRRHVYVVDALPAPRDSDERVDAFIRGFAGLRDEIQGIEARTGGQVGYVGEWHSHPDGAGVDMSDHDSELLRQIAAEVRADGQPGVVMIVGSDQLFGFQALNN
ncbi:MAG: Mov34/MPN/PAD-1 family protein [Gammaproteobacteria bacterium]|nr:Mov34/MPN/PAD-1 family protein [Gammaproteobacteria bacterium]